MPLFKAAMIHNRVKRLTVCATGLQELLKKAIQTLSPSSTPSSFEVSYFLFLELDWNWLVSMVDEVC